MTIRPHTLPRDILARLKDRAHWLRRQFPALDLEMAGACPPIDIVPVCWQATIGGQDTLVGGRVSVRVIGPRQRYVVEITAPTLLEYDDAFVLGVLAHEFLHVVHFTIQRLRADRLREWFGVLPSDVLGTVDMEGCDDSWESYRRVDGALRAHPEVWLSERLQRLVALVEEPQDDAGERVRRQWVARALPIAEAKMDRLAVKDPWLDPAIIAHHDAWMLSVRRESVIERP